MARFTYPVLLLALVIGLAPSALAGPGCARRLQGNSSCVSQCNKRWGWPGRTMGTDPWGNVMKVTVTDVASGSVVTKQCRLRPDSSEPSAVANVASTVSPVPTTRSSSFVTLASSSQPSSFISPSLTVVSQSHNSASFNTSSASTFDIPRSSPARTEVVSVSPSPTHSQTSTSPPAAPSPPSAKATKEASPPPAAAPPPPPLPPPPRPTSTPIQNNAASGGSSTSSSDIDTYLSDHNTVRAQHGASPLTWSDALAAKAQQWANGCLFQHSGGTLGPFGENLAAGTGDSYGIDAAIKSWTDEVSQYDSSNPVPSHFTQVVWKGSSQVGCAVQSCDGIFAASFGKAKYFVCEYQPQGNIIGEFAQNVQA